jgi:hypothetical protein
MTKPKSNAGRKPIADPLDKMETRYISLQARDWDAIDHIALQYECHPKEIVRGLLKMIIDEVEMFEITKADQNENTNDQA